MAVLHRALFTWFILLVFVILLVLRLDGKAIWNWFIIFIPLWIFDALLGIYVVFHMVTHCKNGHDRGDLTMPRKIAYLAGLLLKSTFQASTRFVLVYYNLLLTIQYWENTDNLRMYVF